MKRTLILYPLCAAFLSFVFLGCSQSGNKKMAGGSSNEASAKSSAEASAEQPSVALESTPELVALLHQAALDGDLKGVEKAIASGVDVNGMDEEGRTALMFAGFNGHSEIVLKLLDAESGIDRRDMMGRTALLYAATGPFPETVRILLDKGAEPNVVDSDEHFSPLMHAAAEGNLDVVKILMEADSDATLQDVDGDNAASFARQSGHLEVANYLEAFTNLKE
jgi:ankyrin repeat protein